MKHKEKQKTVANANLAILFIHGIVGSPNHFNKFIEALPEDVSYRAILFSGHGGSVKDFGKAKMEIWRKQAEEAANALLKAHDKLIIVSHSMGTLFAIQEYVKNPDKIPALFLINTPQKVYIHPVMLKYAFYFLRGKAPKRDKIAQAALESISVDKDLKIWRFFGWIPRFLELFLEIRKTRRLLPEIKAKTLVFQSRKDELVRKSSLKLLLPHKRIKTTMLEKSTHFYYDENEMDLMVSEFLTLIKEYK